MRIAVLGGTFNPPHFGHLFFANEVRRELGYDKIIFVPSNLSAHKQNDQRITSRDRINMLELALKGCTWAEISDCDLKRGGVTRTIDTLEDIEKNYKFEGKPGFIIGDDLVEGFSNWKSPDLVSKKSDIIVGCRSGSSFVLDYPHKVIHNRQFPLSSSEIRERVFNNIDIDFLLPRDVVSYIEKNGLYRSN